MALWVSSHIQETFKNKKEQIYLWAWQQLKFIFHKYLKMGSSPFADTDAKVLNWQCKVYIASFVKELSSIFLLYASPALMHGWYEALLDIIIIIVYEFLALRSCRTASWHCWIGNCRHENSKKVAPAAKLLAVFCIPFLSVLKHRMYWMGQTPKSLFGYYEERKGYDSLGGGWRRGCREGLCKVAWELLFPCLITQQRRGHLSTANGGSVKGDALNSPHAGANRGTMQGDTSCLCDMPKHVYAGLMGRGGHWDLRVNACPCKGDLSGSHCMGYSWNQLFQKINWEIFF